MGEWKHPKACYETQLSGLGCSKKKPLRFQNKKIAQIRTENREMAVECARDDDVWCVVHLARKEPTHFLASH